MDASDGVPPDPPAPTGAPTGAAAPQPVPAAPPAARRGVRLGVDVGSVRVGVARSDPNGTVAVPVTTLPRDRSGGADLDAVVALVDEHEVVEVAVGLPRTLAGANGRAVGAARGWGAALVRRLATRPAPVPVVYVDERFTSVTANRVLAERGLSSKARRPVIDQQAAVQILQQRLDTLAALDRDAGADPGSGFVGEDPR
ncbi:Holliday junction resolvase RuvX [Nakamurella leprariae]|uniref:Putative pre-16S rRNA nuclease n=1 Tax=Nakamurella leprariae TaxID=2803911 RepID=A0A939BYD8_9ACTN|nr:Holliday junction resolvase RuvX [Nakamurella leprariae]MBM9466990.1 Holliday junction resolvase RuvX [Nakamurella leprariae]